MTKLEKEILDLFDLVTEFNDRGYAALDAMSRVWSKSDYNIRAILKKCTKTELEQFKVELEDAYDYTLEG